MFQRFEMPKELKERPYEIIEAARDTGKIKRGANEVTKVVERGQAKFIVLALDATPEELLAHLPILCEEKNIPYAYVNSKQELGNATGLKVDTTAAAVIKPGKAGPQIDSLSKELTKLKK